ncbi:MAG: 5-formyltetrahydrofolate cyclo-ligase [Candidatus Firestonebacteria bacterium]
MNQNLKKEIRKKIIKLRDSLSEKERIAKSAEIQNKLFALPEFVNAKTIMFFYTYGSEVMTEQMIRGALKSGKKIILPKVDKNKKELILAEIKNVDTDLVKGTYGIMEPKDENLHIVKPNEIDFVVSPGVAFDSQCNRLGYGGGYYDNLFKKTSKHIPKIAIAYDCQILPSIPVFPFDEPVTKIITEAKIYGRK